MRRRSLAILSTAAVAALALAGCSAETPEEEPTTEAAADLCDAAAPAGDAIDAVEVDGDFGSEASVTFDAPLEMDEIEAKVITEGEGDPLETGEYISYAATVFDAETGEKVGAEGYEAGSALPAAVSTDNIFGMALGCATPGTRVAFTFPGQTTSDGTAYASQVYVLDFFETVPTAATGEEQDPVDGFPTVDVAEDGTPSVTLPEDFSEPDETEIAELKAGDGETVEDGDTVFVQYLGVKGSDGSEFDSSWSRGEPTQFSTSGVIEGFTKALVGQKVGSQVIAVIPPAEGYGASDGNELQDETLVFVVDILGTLHASES
ncbi:FKBP-type peptidyl-prolyl cis-trans isomerase [Microbacterium excoecariae]|uniref:FKBP-type peptidyl-prolyl cis-trans isomerase n=1 Tax=Microbacterium excoecariae TaxID=2715210 RepID=UPI00140C7066|nr:FKBP-type peptidyl-prolyl cis-trans isomerase [Microbacterium excoecariae]